MPRRWVYTKRVKWRLALLVFKVARRWVCSDLLWVLARSFYTSHLSTKTTRFNCPVLESLFKCAEQFYPDFETEFTVSSLLHILLPDLILEFYFAFGISQKAICGLGHQDLGNTREQCLVGSTKLSFKCKPPDNIGLFDFHLMQQSHKEKCHTHPQCNAIFWVCTVPFTLRGLPVTVSTFALGSLRSPKLSGSLPTDENYSRQWSKVWIKTWSKVCPTLHWNFYLPTVWLDIKKSSSSSFVRFLFSLTMNNKEQMCAFIWNVSSGKLLWKGEGSGVEGGGEEGRDRGGWRKRFATVCTKLTNLLSSLWNLSDCFWQVASVASRRVVPFVYSTSWPYFQSQHLPSIFMHQVLDGTPLVADRPFLPTVQVFHQPHSSSKNPIILISEYLMIQIGDASYPMCDAGFSDSKFGVQGTEIP